MNNISFGRLKIDGDTRYLLKQYMEDNKEDFRTIKNGLAKIDKLTGTDEVVLTSQYSSCGPGETCHGYNGYYLHLSKNDIDIDSSYIHDSMTSNAISNAFNKLVKAVTPAKKTKETADDILNIYA